MSLLEKMRLETVNWTPIKSWMIITGLFMWHEWVMSHIWMSHVTHMNKAYHMNESWHRNPEWSSQVFFKTAQLKPLCCNVLQCVAECCSVLQSVTVCCSVLQCVAECYSVLQSVSFQTAHLKKKWTWTIQDSVFNSNNHFESHLFGNGL